MEQVLTKIKEKMQFLQQIPFSKEEELSFLTTFLEDYQLTYEKLSLIHIKDNYELMLGIIAGKNIMAYNEAKKMLESGNLKSIINNLPNDEESCQLLIDDIADLEEYGIETIGYLAFKSDIFFNEDFVNLVIKTHDLALLDCLTIFIKIKRAVAEIRLYCFDSTEKKEDMEALINTIKNDRDMKIYADLTGNKIRHRIKSLKKEKALFDSEISKKVKIYQQIYDCLNSDILIQNISLINELDDDMKQSILEAVLLHNEPFYLNISEKRSSYNNDLRGIFKLNGFNFDKLETTEQQRLLTIGDINNVKTILPIIQKEPFYIGIDDCFLVDILLYSTINIITKITNLYKRGYIDISFIQQNKRILFSNHNGGLYELLSNNLRILKDNKLNIKAIIESNPHVLLMDTKDLMSILELFKKYQINLNNQPGINYTYLTNEHIFDIIDLFIELGHEKFAKDNLELLSYIDANTMKRIYISSMLMIDCNKIDDYLLSGINYPIKNENLNNFIINDTPQYINSNITASFKGYHYQVTVLIETLDKCFQDDNKYFFDDIVISRNKVIRNLTNYQTSNALTEESLIPVLLNAIINNSILDSDQINTIFQSLNRVFSGKKKILQ